MIFLYSPDIKNFLSKAEKHKLQSLNIAEDVLPYTLDYKYRKNAEVIEMCGYRIDDVFYKDGSEKIKSKYCRLRYCPTCAYRKSVKQYGIIIQMAEELTVAWLHCVLTVRNCEGKRLSDTLDLLFKKSSELFKTYKQFKGVIRCCEVTYNADKNTYHPHLHCLIAVNKSYFTSRDYIKQSDLLDKWRNLINENNNGGLYISRVTDKSASVAEVAKYCLKPLTQEIPKEKRIIAFETIYNALQNRRLLQTYGVCRSAYKEIKELYKPTYPKTQDEYFEELEKQSKVDYYYFDKISKRYLPREEFIEKTEKIKKLTEIELKKGIKSVKNNNFEDFTQLTIPEL